MTEPLTFLQAVERGYAEVPKDEYLVRVIREGDFWYGCYSKKEDGPKSSDICLGPIVKP